MKSYSLYKIIAGTVAIGFFSTNALFTYSSETHFWAERRKSARRMSNIQSALPLQGSKPSLIPRLPTIEKIGLSSCVSRTVTPVFLKDHVPLFSALSPAHGTVRKVSPGKKGGPVIVHIQDVHMNWEAQWNIRQTVRSLLEAKQVDLLALEGSAEEIDLQPFVDFPHREMMERTADYLLEENKISGPIHAALTAEGKLPRILGIDDPAHYQANVQAYKDSAPIQEKTRDEIKTLLGVLSAEKIKVYSPALMAFDNHVQAFRSGSGSLANYIFTLAETNRSSHTAKRMARDRIASFQQVSLFEKALTLEKTLNFKQVEHERAQVIDRLVRQLTPQQNQSLLTQSVAYRSGQLRYADFYQEVKALCQKSNIFLSDFPAMNDYIKYVLLADGIDAEKLMEELQNLEITTYDILAQTEEEKCLADKDRRVWLTGKLVDFALTPKEWEILGKPAQTSRTPFAETHGKFQKSDHAMEVAPPRLSQKIPQNENRALENLFDGKRLKSFKLFYQKAIARDEAMARHLLTASQSITSPPQRPATLALVTGGFHAQGLTSALTKAGATVISFVPKIEKVETAQGASYLSVFTQEKTPLENLFAGEKLFLAAPPLPAFSRKFLSFYAWAQALWLGKGHIDGSVLSQLKSLGEDVGKVTKDLVYKQGKLLLKVAGKKIEIISPQGKINFSPMNKNPNPNRRTFLSQINKATGWFFALANWVRPRLTPQNELDGGRSFIQRIDSNNRLREGLIALGVAIFMGSFYFILGAFYSGLFGHLSRLQTLSIIMGTGVLNGVTTWWLVNRWQNASGLNPVAFWPVFLTQLIFFGPLFGFVGNEAIRLIPGFAGIAPHWAQALVGQFLVAPFVFDPLSYVVMRRFVFGETNGDLFQGLKKNMLPYIFLNAILWTPISALGLSFPNNAATNIVASVGGILAGAIGLLFVLRERLPGLNLEKANIDKIRFPPLRLVAQFLNWFFDRSWMPKYLLGLTALGYGALAGLIVVSLFPASNVWFFIVMTTTLGLAVTFNSRRALNYLLNGKFKDGDSRFETPEDTLKDRLTHVAQPFASFLASADFATENRPDVFVVSGSNDLKAYVQFAKIWKSLGADIPVVVAGGRGSGTIVLIRKCLSYYAGRLTQEQMNLLQHAIPTDSSITERDILLKVVFPLESISIEAIRKWFHEETRSSRTTGENMQNVSEIVRRVLGDKEKSSVALVNTPIVILRQSMYAKQIWNKELNHPWRIWRFPTYHPNLAEMDVNELLETLARLVGSPDPSQWDFTLKGELKGIRDALNDNPGSVEIDFSHWENIIVQTLPLYKEYVENQRAQYDPDVKLLLVNDSTSLKSSAEVNDLTRAIVLGFRPLLLGGVATAIFSLLGLASWAVPVGVITALALLLGEQGWLKGISFTVISWLRSLRTPLLFSALLFFIWGEPTATNRREGTPPTIIMSSPKNVSDAAAQTLLNLNTRPTDLGLANYMDREAREIVGQAARRANITSIDPWLKEGKGINVLFLDKRSVADTARRTALNTFLSNKKNVVIITNDEFFTAKGIQIFRRPNAFSPLLTEIENASVPSGIVEVSILQLSNDLKSIGQGVPLQFFQTNVTKLNAAKVDEGLAGLTKRSWLLSETFEILSPAEAIDWSKILKTLAEIARHA